MKTAMTVVCSGRGNFVVMNAGTSNDNRRPWIPWTPIFVDPHDFDASMKKVSMDSMDDFRDRKSVNPRS